MDRWTDGNSEDDSWHDLNSKHTDRRACTFVCTGIKLYYLSDKYISKHANVMSMNQIFWEVNIDWVLVRLTNLLSLILSSKTIDTSIIADLSFIEERVKVNWIVAQEIYYSLTVNEVSSEPITKWVRWKSLGKQ